MPGGSRADPPHRPQSSSGRPSPRLTSKDPSSSTSSGYPSSGRFFAEEDDTSPLPRAPKVDPREHTTAQTSPISRTRKNPPTEGSSWSWRMTGRTILALASTLVLLVTGYAWVSLSDLTRGLSTSDVTSGAGSDGAVDILLVGKDSRTDSQGNPLPADVLKKLKAGDNDASLTDTLILMHIPKDHTRAVAYSIPRDSYVAIPGHGKHKINSAFGTGKAAAKEDLRGQGVTDSADLDRRASEAGRKLLVNTVGDLTGASIDHYAEVNLLGFYQITKAVGGVQVCLKGQVNDSYSGAHFAEGVQTVSGGDAMAFVRQRHGLPRGDLDRVRRQQAFLAGLSHAMLSGGTLSDPAKIGGLFQSLKRSIVLDQGWNPLTFAQQMQNLTGGNVTFDTIPIEDPGYSTSEGEVVKLDPRQVRETVQRVNKGLPPAPSPPAELASSTVDVRNSTDTSGLASKVAHELKKNNIAVGSIGNGSPRNTSKVSYGTGTEKAAQYVARQLGGLPVMRNPEVRNHNIRVRIADNYRGPGARHNFASARKVRLDGRSAKPASPPRQRSGDAITAGGIACVN